MAVRNPIRGTRVAGAVVLASASLALAATHAHAETTPTETATVDLGDLDASGTGTFEAFDPGMGTLSQVDLEVRTTMDFEVCVHNRSSEPDSIPAGDVTGAAPISFPADVVSDAIGAMSIPDTPVAASDQVDDCLEWLDGGAEPSSSDTLFQSESAVDEFTRTLTDPADLAEYVGPDTVDYSFESSSDSAIGQPSAWTSTFRASGSAELSITYSFDPAEGSGSLDPAADARDGGTLTGSSDLSGTGAGESYGWMIVAAGIIILAGTVLVATGRWRRSRSSRA